VADSADLKDRYLDLMKKALTASLYDQSRWGLAPRQERSVKRKFADALVGKHDWMLVDPKRFSEEEIIDGRVWTMLGYTMVGHHRLDNVRHCVETALRDNVPGDLVETGSWRGGVTIFMRAILKAHDIHDRKVWVADSFEGLPVPKDAADGDDLSAVDELKVSLETVKQNFARFDLLDDQVVFLKGWFSDTLPTAPIGKIAVLRLDGDLYSSTMDALGNLYDKVSPGGYVIVDDYYSWDSCRRAITDFLAARGLNPEILPIDWTGAYWRV
jgi:O-methyltransferase